MLNGLGLSIGFSCCMKSATHNDGCLLQVVDALIISFYERMQSLDHLCPCSLIRKSRYIFSSGYHLLFPRFFAPLQLNLYSLIPSSSF